MGVFLFLFVFFAKRSTFHGLYNCKLKNDIALILIFFSQKKKQTNKQTKLAQWALAFLVQSFSLTSFHNQGSRSVAHKQYFSLFKRPGQDHVRVSRISEVNIELQLFSVTLACRFEPPFEPGGGGGGTPQNS